MENRRKGEGEKKGKEQERRRKPFRKSRLFDRFEKRMEDENVSIIC